MKNAHNQVRNAAGIGQSRNRVEQLRQHAAAGHTFAEACEAIGTTEKAARSILHRYTGSTLYPPRDQ